MNNPVHINGNAQPLAGHTLAEIMRGLGYDTTSAGVAVACNDEVIPKSLWAHHVLKANDRIEIVGATAGG